MYQINVIEAAPMAFDYLAFPNQSPATAMYFQNQLQNFNAALNETGQRFMQGARELYARINDSTAIRMARAAIKHAKGMYHPNAIIQIDDIEGLRNATPMMQNYIMAQPDLRDLYHRQQVNGYSDTYIDLDPKKNKDEHYYYRRVMDTVVQDSEENGEYRWVAKQYYDELLEGHADLSIDERHSIMMTWDNIQSILAEDKDPTDIFGD
jgi:hypothetical protein